MPNERKRWTGEQFQQHAMAACKLALEGLTTDGAHHKQWYLEQIAIDLGTDLEDFKQVTGLDWENGIAQ